MTTADTSVLVAGFAVQHQFHDAVQTHLASILREGQLVSHTIAETYLVLSSPSGVFRAEPAAVTRYLAQFTQTRPPIEIRPQLYLEAAKALAERGRGGGAIYDAIIALAAREADATLVTIDSRAVPIYEICRTRVQVVTATG